MSVLQPGAVHCVTIGMPARYPFETNSSLSRHIPVHATEGVPNACRRVHIASLESPPMRVLSITHGPSVPGGVFDEAVEAGGKQLERWVVPDGGSPEPAGSYDAVMVFGGSQHPDEDARFAWLRHEEAFLQDVLAAEVPVFGVCLGAQMLARAAGASIGPASRPEIGWHEIVLTEPGAADPVLGTLPPSPTVFQWHHYAFDVPPNAVALAESPVCLQSFRVDGLPAWGIQFHAEVTGEMLSAWIEEDPRDLPMPPEELRAESETRLARSNEYGRALADAFLRVASARSRRDR